LRRERETTQEEADMNDATDEPLVSAATIRESPLGLDLSDAQCAALADVAGLVGLEAGHILLEEGHVDENLYVVSSGSLEVIKPTGNAESVTLQLLHSGDMAGILGFVDGVPHSAGIRALTPCELITIGRSDLEGMLTKHPEVVYQVMRAVVRTAHRILAKMNTQFVEMSNYITQQHGRY
jgi:CRP/FNR family cyclic AMP-dependent transcriptional regulator